MDVVKHKGKRYGSCDIKCYKVFLTARIIGKLSFVRKENVVLEKNICLFYKQYISGTSFLSVSTYPVDVNN